jgi:DNA helicase HerA-like ATPase
MMLGKVSGRTTTKRFGFTAEARVNKLDYLSAKDPEGKFILAIADSVVQYSDLTKVSARVIGYRDRRGFLQTPKVPLAPETPVYAAEKFFINETLGLQKSGAYIGLLEGYDIQVMLDIEHMIRKHIAVLAKTGAGKSYVVGVLLEEFAEKGIPVVVIDPHGEYSTLRRENKKQEELRFSERFGVEPKSYRNQVNSLSLSGPKEIKLDSKLTAEEIFQMLPAGISSSQKGILYSSLKNLEGKDYTLRDIIEEVSTIPSSSKWNLISMLEFLANTNLFSANPTLPKELVQEKKISVIDLKDGRPEIQQIVVMKVIEELFKARKHGTIPPFILVLEEAHNFCPERGFGEVASSKIVRSVASEGRKFGFGLCVVTQRPARIDKSVLSQCNTQLILKVTNPNDLKAITDSVEGVTQGIKEEIKDLSVGSAIVVGATENPLMVDIRIRRTQHGGEDLVIEETEKEEGKTLAFQPRFTKSDIGKVYKGISDVSLVHYPLWKVKSRFKSYTINFFVDGLTGEMVFEKNSSIERSRGIRELLELPPSSRLIIFYLQKNSLSTLEKLSEDLKMPLSTVQSNIKDLLSRDFISTDGYAFRSKLRLENIPPNPHTVQLSEKAGFSDIPGKRIDFMVSMDFAKKVSELWDLSIIDIKPVYYPYWMLNHKGKNIMIDGVFKKLDSETTDAAKKFL